MRDADLSLQRLADGGKQGPAVAGAQGSGGPQLLPLDNFEVLAVIALDLTNAGIDGTAATKAAVAEPMAHFLVILSGINQGDEKGGILTAGEVEFGPAGRGLFTGPTYYGGIIAPGGAIVSAVEEHAAFGAEAGG